MTATTILAEFLTPDRLVSDDEAKGLRAVARSCMTAAADMSPLPCSDWPTQTAQMLERLGAELMLEADRRGPSPGRQL